MRDQKLVLTQAGFNYSLLRSTKWDRGVFQCLRNSGNTSWVWSRRNQDEERSCSVRTHGSLLHFHQSFIIEESAECRPSEISIHRSSCTREWRLEWVSAHASRKLHVELGRQWQCSLRTLLSTCTSVYVQIWNKVCMQALRADNPI